MRWSLRAKTPIVVPAVVAASPAIIVDAVHRVEPHADAARSSDDLHALLLRHGWDTYWLCSSFDDGHAVASPERRV